MWSREDPEFTDATTDWLSDRNRTRIGPPNYCCDHNGLGPDVVTGPVSGPRQLEPVDRALAPHPQDREASVIHFTDGSAWPWDTPPQEVANSSHLERSALHCLLRAGRLGGSGDEVAYNSVPLGRTLSQQCRADLSWTVVPTDEACER